MKLLYLLNIPCHILILSFIRFITANSIQSYVIFLNRSIPSFHLIESQIKTYSIGDFHWYIDHLNDHEVKELSLLDHILSLHKDETIFQSSEQIQTDLPSWGLDRIDQRKGGDDKFHFPSSAGEGVDIYLIDTGVNIDHIDFDGRATYGPTFISEEDDDPTDFNGHGTFVAGVCCGKVYGVAKKSNVISLKVLDRNGSGKLSNILLALHWVVQRHISNLGSKSIVNLSLAAEYHLPTNQAVEQASKLGIHFSIAAGNQGEEACRYSPASTKNTLVVGALNPDDSVATYSNYGPCVDVYAPGTAITSVWNHNRKDVHILSGTSMAAPHVAGVMAILLSEKDYSPTELVEKIKKTATVTQSSRAQSQEVSYRISQLTGTAYDSNSIRVLYIEPSYLNPESLSLKSSSGCHHLLIPLFYLIYFFIA